MSYEQLAVAVDELAVSNRDLIDTIHASQGAALEATARFCGVFPTAPSSRLDGSALQEADEYQNSVDKLRYSWTGSEWIALNADVQELEESLVSKVDGKKGAARLGYHGQNLAVSLQNRNGAAGLKRFVQTLYEKPSNKRLNVRLVGTSISTGNSASSIFAQALCDYFGESKSTLLPFASQAEQPINGWKTQYYSGTYSIRLRGGNGDGALPITIQRRATSITIFHGKEDDGGSVGVSIQTGNQPAVVQSPIVCSGQKAINVPVTYNLDPNYVSTIVITPPTSGFGYVEYYITDAGDYGMMFANTSYGGSGLWGHVGNGPNGQVVRPAATGMYPSATPEGDLGFIATVAPEHVQVKPELLIYSGPTNDAGNGANYPGQLLKLVRLAVANGSAVILVIEPLNYSSVGLWPPLRAAYYAAAAEYPDSVFVYDYDGFISWDLTFNPKFHSPSLSDPHPGDYGYGNPHTAAANDMCQRLGIPFQRKQGRVPSTDLTRVYTQPNEPLQAVVGSVWTDTSTPGGIPKKLLSRVEGWGSRGLWECNTSDNKVVGPYSQDYLIAGPVNFGTRAVGTNFLGDPCVVLTGQTSWSIDKTLFEPGQVYTVSYLYESNDILAFNNIFTFGAAPFFKASVAKQAFEVSTNNVAEVSSALGAGRLKRFVLTVKWPTLEEQAAATTAGVNMGLLAFTVQGPSAAKPLSMWSFRVEKGASVTNFTKPVANMATTMPLSPIAKAIEPLPSIVPEGGAWSDISNTPALLKRMLQKDCLVNVAAAAPGVFGTGVSLWRPPTAQQNLMAGFVENGALTVMTGGSTVTRGNFGPGDRAGFRWDTLTGNASTQVELLSAPGSLELVPNTVYTLSFLMRAGRGDNVVDTIRNFPLYTNLEGYNPTGPVVTRLQTDLVTWTTAPGAWKVGQCVRDQTYRRFKLTFKSYATAPGSPATNSIRLSLLSYNIDSQWCELSDFRLEVGASVTAD